MRRNTIHRKTNYIEFVAKIDTNGTNAGCVYEAVKKYGNWQLRDEESGKCYYIPVATLRALIGEIIVQAEVDLSIETSLLFGF